MQDDLDDPGSIRFGRKMGPSVVGGAWVKPVITDLEFGCRIELVGWRGCEGGRGGDCSGLGMLELAWMMMMVRGDGPMMG